MHKKTVLFIAGGYSKSVPRGLRFKNIIKYLVKDYNVHILAFDYGIPVKKSSVYHLYFMEHLLLLKILNKNIFYPSLTNTVKGKFVGLFNLLLSKRLFPDIYIIEKNKIINKIIELHTQYNFDIIVGVAVPYTTLLIGKELKEKGLNFKWVVDIGDPFAENSAGKLSKNAKEKAEFYEESTLAYADAIVVTNSMTKNMYKEKYQKLAEKEIAVIPQGANIIMKHEKSNVTNSELTLVYAGAFYPKLREPYELFKAIVQWDESCNFEIYGASNIYGLHSQKINFMDKASHEKIIDAYSNADALVFIDNAYGLQTSGKIFELLAMKKPILFISDNSESPTKELLREHNFVFFSKNNVRDIKQALKNIKENKESCIFDFDIDTVSWERRSEEYVKLFEKLLETENYHKKIK